jgi:type II secretory pathway component PulK
MKKRAREKGAALILVLWTFAVLSVLAAEFATAMRQEAQSVLNFKEKVLGHYTAMAGINEALLAVLTYNGDIEIIDDDDVFGDDDGDGRRKNRKNAKDDEEEEDEEEEEEARVATIRELIAGRGDWVEATFNGKTYEVRVYDESGRIPLNAKDLEEESLFKILENLEYDESLAREVAAAILDWRDEDDLHRNEGVESDYYEGLDPPYKAKNAPFDAVEELLLIKGITHEMFYGTDEIPGFVDIFSVLSTRGHITQNAISTEVEQALCGTIDGYIEDKNDALGAGDGDGETVQDLETCIKDVGLSARRSDRDGKPNLTTARIEARVKNSAGRVVTHIGATVRFKGDVFQTYQWYDAVFDDDEGS